MMTKDGLTQMYNDLREEITRYICGIIWEKGIPNGDYIYYTPDVIIELDFGAIGLSSQYITGIVEFRINKEKEIVEFLYEDDDEDYGWNSLDELTTEELNCCIRDL